MSSEKDPELSTKREKNWMLVLFQLQLTISFLCAVRYVVYESFWATVIYSLVLTLFAFLGVTAGAHRLWAHRSYEANTQLRFFLALCQTLAGCGSIYEWVKLHRLHHKHFNTVLDPYNPSRGFFYAHVTSNTLKLSPAQEHAMKDIDMSDLEEDKIIMFQKKYYIPLFLIVTLLFPINAPPEYWGESIIASIFLVGWFKYFIILHLTWLIHSATKIWALQPGEKYPCDTNLVFILSKNYWLSYHYLAPWDYQTSEYSKYGDDFVSKFIRVCAALECASDLKTLNSDSVRTALTISLKEKKNISESLKESYELDSKLPEDHYLRPAEFR